MALGGALGPGLGGRDAAAFCVAGVALGDIHFRSHPPSFSFMAWAQARHSAWQAWHLVTFTFVSRGRRGTNSHLRSFCVAGASLMALGGALGPGLGGRDAAAFCVAGVALGDIHFRFAWQAWHNLTSTLVLRGRRFTHGTVW